MSSRAKTESRADSADTKIQVVADAAAAADNKSDKVGSNVIECSVNMNVSLSRLNKRSKIFQRAQSLLIVIIAIVFAIVCSHLKREVRALEVQIDCMNANLMVLMLRYDKLSKNFNRVWYHGPANRSPHHPLVDSSRQPNQKYRHASASKEASPENVSRGNARVAVSPRKSRYEGEKSAKIAASETVNVVLDDEARSIDDREDEKISSERDRYERAIVAFERRNQETTTAMPRDDQSDDTNTWNESRTGRYRRDEGRGKKRRKIKRRLKRSRRRLGPLVATFVGAVPEQHVTDTVYVGPWVKSARNDSRYAFNKFHLVEDKTSIEVTANGLYMISAQIYYFGEPTHYSYWILLSSEGVSTTRKVIKCATVSAVSASEASCYTSVVLPLRRGDRLHIQQQERDRLINLREGHSYVQIMLLSSETPRRRGS